MSTAPRPAPQISMDRLVRLEESAADLFEASKVLLKAVGEVQTALKALNIQGDAVAELDRAKKPVEHLVNKRIRKTSSLYVMAPTLEALRKANELVLADNACILGRDGCEKRWDTAMAALKKALGRFNFDVPNKASGSS